MKKTMSFIASIALAAAMVSALPTFAEETAPENTSSTKVTEIDQDSPSKISTVDISYTKGTSYRVTIPTDTLTLSKAETPIKIEAKEVIINEGNTLKVTVKGKEESEWKLSNGKTTKIDYSVTSGEDKTPVNPGDVVLSVAANEAVNGNEVKKELTINAPTKANISGTYSDQLTFTVGVSDASGSSTPDNNTDNKNNNNNPPADDSDDENNKNASGTPGGEDLQGGSGDQGTTQDPKTPAE